MGCGTAWICEGTSNCAHTILREPRSRIMCSIEFQKEKRFRNDEYSLIMVAGRDRVQERVDSLPASWDAGEMVFFWLNGFLAFPIGAGGSMLRGGGFPCADKMKIECKFHLGCSKNSPWFPNHSDRKANIGTINHCRRTCIVLISRSLDSGF